MEMPKEIWAYFDDGNGALWHQPLPGQDQSAVKYLRADLWRVPEDHILSIQIDKACDMALDDEACLEYCRSALRTIQSLNSSRTNNPKGELK